MPLGKIAEAYVEARLDDKKLNRGLDQVSRRSQQATQKMSSGFRKRLGPAVDWVSKRLKLLGVAAGAAFALFVKASAKAYVSLEKMDALFDVTLKTRAPRMRAWAEGFAKAAGLSASETRKFSGQLFLMFKGLGVAGDRAEEMSKQLTKVIRAVAIFRGQDSEAFFRKVQSGLVGMSQSLLRVGISIKEGDAAAAAARAGLTKTFKTMSEGEKVYARYLALLEQTKEDMAALTPRFNTLHKALTQQADAWGDLKEAAGEFFVELAGGRRGIENITKATRGLEKMHQLPGLQEAAFYGPLRRAREEFAKRRGAPGAVTPYALRRLQEQREQRLAGGTSGIASLGLILSGAVGGIKGALVPAAKEAAEVFSRRVGEKMAAVQSRIASIGAQVGISRGKLFETALGKFGQLLPAATGQQGRFERILEARERMQDIEFVQRQGFRGRRLSHLLGKAQRTIRTLAPEFFGQKGVQKLLAPQLTAEEKQMTLLQRQLRQQELIRDATQQTADFLANKMGYAY